MLTQWRKGDILRYYRLFGDKPDTVRKISKITGITEKTISALIDDFQLHEISQGIDEGHRGKGDYKHHV